MAQGIAGLACFVRSEAFAANDIGIYFHKIWTASDICGFAQIFKKLRAFVKNLAEMLIDAAHRRVFEPVSGYMQSVCIVWSTP